jgi:hypothetical protein
MGSTLDAMATFLQGKLNVGEAMAPPVIRAVLASAPKDSAVEGFDAMNEAGQGGKE